MNFAELDVSLVVEQDEDGVATLTMSGPSDVWFGVGFDATEMADRPYTVIVDGSTGSFHERTLARYDEGDVREPVLVEVAPPVLQNGRCWVKVRHPSHLLDSTSSGLDVIAAVGTSTIFGYHSNKMAGRVDLVEPVSSAMLGQVARHLFST